MNDYRGPPMAPMAPTAHSFGPASGLPRTMPIPMHQQPFRPQPQPQQQAQQPQDPAPKPTGSKSTPILHVEKKPRYIGCTFTAQDAGNDRKSWKNASQTIWSKPQSEIAQIAKKKFRSTPRGNVDVTPNVPLEDLPSGVKALIEKWLDEKIELEAEPDIYEWSIAAIRTKSKGGGLFSSGKNAVDVVLKRAVQKSVREKIEAASTEADEEEPRLRRAISTGDLRASALGHDAIQERRAAKVADRFGGQPRAVPLQPAQASRAGGFDAPRTADHFGGQEHPWSAGRLPGKLADNFGRLNNVGQRPSMDPHNARFFTTGMPPNVPNFFGSNAMPSSGMKQQPSHLPGKFPLPPESVISSEDDSYIEEDDVLFSDREPQPARNRMPFHPGAASYHQSNFGAIPRSAPPQGVRFEPQHGNAPIYHTAVPSNAQKGGIFASGMPAQGSAPKVQFREGVPMMSGALPQTIPVPPPKPVPMGGMHHQPDIRNMHNLFAAQQPEAFQSSMPGVQAQQQQPAPAAAKTSKQEGKNREQSESPPTDKAKEAKSKRKPPQVVYPIYSSSDESSEESFDDNDTIRTPMTGSSIGEEVPLRRKHRRHPSSGKHKAVDSAGYRVHTRRPSQPQKVEKDRNHRRKNSSDTEEGYIMVDKGQRPRAQTGLGTNGQQPSSSKYPVGRSTSRPSTGKEETAIVSSAPDALAKDPFKEQQREEMRRTQISERERELERLQQELHDLELLGRDRKINELRREKERRIDELHEMTFRQREDERRFEEEKEVAHQRRLAEMEDMVEKLGRAGRNNNNTTNMSSTPGARNSYREKEYRDPDPLLEDDDSLPSRSNRNSRQRYPKVYEVSPEPASRRSRTFYDDEFDARERVYEDVGRYRRADKERDRNRDRDRDLRDSGLGYESQRMRNLRQFDKQTDRMRARRGSFY